MMREQPIEPGYAGTIEAAFHGYEMPEPIERIVAAALRMPNKSVSCTPSEGYPGYLIISAPAPNRHHHLLHPLHAMTGRHTNPSDQGFTTSTGRYVGRAEALLIAKAANQIKVKCGNPDELYSEDLW